MTTYEHEVENSKYKLLGFENDKSLAVIMVIATGKIIRIKLSEVLNSEICKARRASSLASRGGRSSRRAG